MEPHIIVNKAICNKCNDEIISKHRHDFVTCSCGKFSVDGGRSYIRRIGDDYTETTLYSDDPFEKLRKHIFRGGRGKDGTEDLKYVALNEMGNDWLENVITYENEHRPDNTYLPFYEEELEYRKQNNIFIEE